MDALISSQSEDSMSSREEDVLRERMDGMVSALGEECEIVVLLAVRKDEAENAFVAIASKGNVFELIGVLEDARQEIVRLRKGS